jgi:hypothetical protein
MVEGQLPEKSCAAGVRDAMSMALLRFVCMRRSWVADKWRTTFDASEVEEG